MNKAVHVIRLLNEVEGVPLGDLASVKNGQSVMFRKGHELDGVTGIIISTSPEKGTADIKIGKATRVAVPAGDLLKIMDAGAAVGEPGKTV